MASLGTASIYKITNVINGKAYIGQTCDPRKRFQEHKTRCHNKHLARAIGRYGIDSFEFEIIETLVGPTAQAFIDSREEQAIAAGDYTNRHNGYNIKPGGANGPHSAETCEKIGACNRGRTRSLETRRKLSESHKGKKLSKESISKRTQTRQAGGAWFTAEHKNNIRDALRGVTRGAEWKKKQSESKLGIPWSTDRRAAQNAKGRVT